MKANRLAMIFGIVTYFMSLLLILAPNANPHVMFAVSMLGGFIFITGFMSYVKER